MSSKKVTILNQGLLKNETDSSNKDKFKENFGSWYSKETGFQFIEKSSKTITLTFEDPISLPETPISLPMESPVAPSGADPADFDSDAPFSGMDQSEDTLGTSPESEEQEQPDFYKFKQKVYFGTVASDQGAKDIDEANSLYSKIYDQVRTPSGYITFEDFATKMRVPIAHEEAYAAGGSSDLSEYAGVTFEYNYSDRAYEKVLSSPAATVVTIPSLYEQVTNLKNEVNNVDPENPDSPLNLKAPTSNLLSRNIRKKRRRRRFKTQMVVGDPLKTIAPFQENKELFPFHAEINLPLGRDSEIASAIQETDLASVLMRDFVEGSSFGEWLPPQLQSLSKENLSYSIDYLTGDNTNKTKNFIVNFLTMDLNDWWKYDLPVWAGSNPSKLPATSMFISTEHTNQEDLAVRGAENIYSFLADPPEGARIQDMWNKAWIAALGIPTMQGKFTDLMKAHARTFEDIVKGESAYSESVLYKVRKYRGRSTSGTPIQEFYTYNSISEEGGIGGDRRLSFIDTQLKLDVDYTYVVTEFRALIGARYSYESLTSAEDMWLGEDGRIWGSMDAVVEPIIKLVEIPLFIAKGRVLAPPPIPPEVNVISYKGVSDQMMFFFNSNIGSSLEEPIPFSYQENLNNRQYLLQTNSPTGEISYSTTSAIAFVEVYRMARRPNDITDFKNKLLMTVSTDIAERTALTAGSIGKIIKQKPNKKFYYIFRALGDHEEVSNPSPIYEIELYNDGGVSYPIVKIFDIESVNPRTKTKSFRNLLRITPKITQAMVNESASGLIKGNGSLGNAFAKNIVLGLEDESLFGKRFKIRLTSKHTGKKIDLNMAFATKSEKSPGAFGPPAADLKEHLGDPSNEYSNYTTPVPSADGPLLYQDRDDDWESLTGKKRESEPDSSGPAGSGGAGLNYIGDAFD
tara:strand:- start:109 stop:2844 length:2736 start_codon:yes stop_codon:yes gene_type:complete